MSVYAEKFAKTLARKISKEMKRKKVFFEEACANLCVLDEESALLKKIAEENEMSLEDFIDDKTDKTFVFWHDSISVLIDKNNKMTISFQLPHNGKIIATIFTILSVIIGVGQEFVRRELAWSSIYNMQRQQEFFIALQEAQSDTSLQSVPNIQDDISIETLNRYGFRGDEQWIRRRAERRPQNEQNYNRGRPQTRPERQQILEIYEESPESKENYEISD
jgi:hypothetical protein